MLHTHPLHFPPHTLGISFLEKKEFGLFRVSSYKVNDAWFSIVTYKYQKATSLTCSHLKVLRKSMPLTMSALIRDRGKPCVELVKTSVYKYIQYVTSRHSGSWAKMGNDELTVKALRPVIPGLCPRC